MGGPHSNTRLHPAASKDFLSLQVKIKKLSLKSVLEVSICWIHKGKKVEQIEQRGKIFYH